MVAERLLVRDVAERLGVDRVEVYRLIRTGALDGRPDDAGDMRVRPQSVGPDVRCGGRTDVILPI